MKINDKKQIIKELKLLEDKYNKEYEEDKIKKEKKLFFLSFLSSSFKKNIIYFLFLSYIIFYFKNGIDGQLNFFQIKYFMDSFFLSILSCIINFVFCLIKCFFNKNLDLYYRKKSLKLSLEIILVILILIITKGVFI